MMLPCQMTNKTYATSLTERLLEAGDHAGVDYWWEGGKTMNFVAKFGKIRNFVI